MHSQQPALRRHVTRAPAPPLVAHYEPTNTSKSTQEAELADLVKCLDKLAELRKSVQGEGSAPFTATTTARPASRKPEKSSPTSAATTTTTTSLLLQLKNHLAGLHAVCGMVSDAVAQRDALTKAVALAQSLQTTAVGPADEETTTTVSSSWTALDPAVVRLRRLDKENDELAAKVEAVQAELQRRRKQRALHPRRTSPTPTPTSPPPPPPPPLTETSAVSTTSRAASTVAGTEGGPLVKMAACYRQRIRAEEERRRALEASAALALARYRGRQRAEAFLSSLSPATAD